MVSDAVAFAAAYAVVWAGIGLYLVHVHRLVERVSDEVARLEKAKGADEEG